MRAIDDPGGIHGQLQKCEGIAVTEPMEYRQYTIIARDPSGKEIASKPLRLSPGDFETGQYMAAQRGAELYRDIAYLDFGWRSVEGIPNPGADLRKAIREANA